jgi:hypothetical protein
VKRAHVWWSGKLLWGTLLIGFGLFNLVEGVIDHPLLGLYHVNEAVPQTQRIYWDLGFLAWGALMLLVGWWLLRTGEQETTEPLWSTMVSFLHCVIVRDERDVWLNAAYIYQRANGLPVE